MSDSLSLEDERKKEALNTNAPSTGILSPVLQQITAGNPGGAVAAQEAARKTDQNVQSDFAKSVQTTASQIESAFKAGQAAVKEGASSSSINNSAAIIGGAQSNILGIGAEAASRAILKDGLAEAQQTQAMQRRLISAGLNPDGNALNNAIDVIGGNLKSATDKMKSVAEMRKTGFFDNPAAYIYNNLIDIPLTVNSAARDMSSAKLMQSGLAATADALKQTSLIDAAYFSSKDAERAGLMATATLASAKSAAMQPLTNALQQQLGALNLRVSEGQLGVAQGNLALSQQANARAEDLHPIMKEAATLRNTYEKLQIANFPQTVEHQKTQIDEAKIRIAQAPNAAERAAAELELKKLEVKHAQSTIELDPGRLQQQQQSLQYGELLKDDQLLKNKTQQLVLDENLKKLKQTAEGEKAKIDTINLGLQAMGLKGELTSTAGMSPEQEQALFAIGHGVVQNGKLGIQGDPVATMDLFKKAKIGFGENTPAGWQVSKAAVDSAITSANTELDKLRPGEAKLTGTARMDALQTGVRNKFLNQQVTEGWKPDNSIFSIPSLDVMTKSPWGAENPIVKEMAPLAVDGAGNPVARQVDGTMLLNTAAGAVSKGKLTEDQAVKALNDLTKRIQENANTSFGYAASGIPLIANQFNTQVKTPGALWGNNTSMVDLMSYAKTQLALRRQIAQLKSGTEHLSNPYGDNSLLFPASGQSTKGTLETDLQKRARGDK